jgi:hypothetical protein
MSEESLFVTKDNVKNLLTELLTTEELVSQEEADRLIAAYPEIVIKAIMYPEYIRSVAKSLIIKDLRKSKP